MLPRQWPDHPPARPSGPPIDWKAWIRCLDRKRRALERLRPSNGVPLPSLPRAYLAEVTRASFQLDGIRLDECQLAGALARGAAGRVCRSRQGQRLRNHTAILRRIGGIIRRGQPLGSGAVVRWYTCVSCGLSSARLDGESLARLDRVVGRINSPHLNLRPAVEEIARLHFEMLSDPIVPSFNGILARLLLDCQLGRCGLPPVLFDPERDRQPPADAGAMLRRLLEVIQGSYDGLLAS